MFVGDILLSLIRLVLPRGTDWGRPRSGIGDWSGDGEDGGEEEEANSQIYRRAGCLPGCPFDPEAGPEIYLFIF